MSIGGKIANFATRHPLGVTLTMAQITLAVGLLAALPSIWPEVFAGLHSVKVDTDPENMLPADEPVRVFHDHMKEEMALYDMVVVGVVNEEHPDGVFNPDSLARVHEIAEFAKTELRWPDPENPEEEEGVIAIDMIAPSNVDTMRQGDSPGVVRFEWLMKSPPETAEEARAIRERARNIPFLNGTLLSEDGKALALYLPLTSKDVSSRVYDALNKRIAELDGDDQWHITGLPVAEDVFGVEMFKQMAISAPLAMLVIFLLLLFFFRKLTLVLSPMIVALVCTILTMGLLVVAGQTVHIMSSMIPIFIMPIAVLDAVHILSEFFDRYQQTRDRRQTMLHVMDTLFMPMLYTSVTTAVGFGSLALVPIPPVQVFGVFVAVGVLFAWVWTITFIPAFVMFIPERRLENFGTKASENDATKDEQPRSPLNRLLNTTGRGTYAHAKLILVGVAALAALAVYGITQIRINDNPINWFNRSHPIRVADRVLNNHFAGTYMAYLTLTPAEQVESPQDLANALGKRLDDWQQQNANIANSATVAAQLREQAQTAAQNADSAKALLNLLERFADENLFEAPREQMEAWDGIMTFLSDERGRLEVFKQPEVLRLMERINEHLLSTGIVGKANALPDVVKTVHRELFSGEEKDFRIPDSSAAVAQTLLQYQNSHRPQDLWHFVTPDYRKAVMWLQLKSGNNRDMEKVVHSMKDFMEQADMPLGVGIEHRWFGLTYINVVWQEKMVAGMLNAFMGSFVIVFLMMTLLYRSALWGLLSMLPLTVTIAFIYGLIGLVGKDYDMPVAILSALSLGLAVDYAIHFLSRSRGMRAKYGSWQAAAGPVFDEPARAIARNAIVVGVGFLPLLAAPLVPYKTVGVFIAAILFVAGLASLVILPALIRLLEPMLFPQTEKCCLLCKCGTCILTTTAGAIAVVVNLKSLLGGNATALTWTSLLVILLLAQGCFLVSRHKRCRDRKEAADSPEN